MKSNTKDTKAVTFQKARTTRRLARRRGWQVPDATRNPKTGTFTGTFRFSLDRRPS